MFNTYVINPDNSAAIKQVAASNRKLADTLRENSENEVKSRDRVDISREEYENMKNKIRDLEDDKCFMSDIFKKIEFPILDLLCRDRDSVEVKNLRSYYGESTDPKSFIRSTRCQIIFDIVER